MAPLVFRFKPLTPLWLGGQDGDSKYIKESGIVGSMRFWYGGLLARANKTEKEREELFGTTGFRRAFHVRAEGLRSLSLDEYNSRSPVKLGTWLGTHRHALFADDEFTITIVPHWGKERLVGERVPYLLRTMTELGGIGAKTQHGFGQVRFLNQEEFRGGMNDGAAALSRVTTAHDDRFFTLHEDRFSSVLWHGAALPTHLPANLPAAIRNDVAPSLPDDQTRKIVLGFVPEERSNEPPRGARLHVTVPYHDGSRWCVKVWVDSHHRAGILRAVKNYMEGSFSAWTPENIPVPTTSSLPR